MKKFEAVKLQELLDENPAQIFLELSLNVTSIAVSKHLHAMGKIHKEGNITIT